MASEDRIVGGFGIAVLLDIVDDIMIADVGWEKLGLVSGQFRPQIPP